MSGASAWDPGSIGRYVADVLTSISLTAVTIGSGVKTFVAEPNKLFIIGSWVLAIDTADSNNWIIGQVVSYNESTGALVMLVPANGFSGAGTKSSWTITLSGMRGVTGDLGNPVITPMTFNDAMTLLSTLSVAGAATFLSTVTLAADPTLGLQAATKQYVDSVTPAGVVEDYAGFAVPAGYLLCDGTAVSRTAYARLYAAIGVVWGVGDGVTTFNLPNLARRVIIGSGGTGSVVIGNGLSNVGGEEAHTLTLNELVPHTHPVQAIPTTNTAAGAGGGSPVSPPYVTATGSTGGGAAFNIMQPSVVMYKIIKT